jgi:putative FmdB family regulatory protein
MPTYDYRCPNGHDFEHFYRNISEATAEFACPTCGAVGQRRISGGAGLVFKGSGFYLTDYGKNAHRAPVSSKGEGGGDGKADAGADGKKSDARSDAKSETPKGDSGASASSSDASGGKSAAPSESKQSSEQKAPPAKSKGGDAQ